MRPVARTEPARADRAAGRRRARRSAPRTSPRPIPAGSQPAAAAPRPAAAAPAADPDPWIGSAHQAPLQPAPTRRSAFPSRCRAGRRRPGSAHGRSPAPTRSRSASGRRPPRAMAAGDRSGRVAPATRAAGAAAHAASGHAAAAHGAAAHAAGARAGRRRTCRPAYDRRRLPAEAPRVPGAARREPDPSGGEQRGLEPVGSRRQRLDGVSGRGRPFECSDSAMTVASPPRTRRATTWNRAVPSTSRQSTSAAHATARAGGTGGAAGAPLLGLDPLVLAAIPGRRGADSNGASWTTSLR